MKEALKEFADGLAMILLVHVVIACGAVVVCAVFKSFFSFL